MRFNAHPAACPLTCGGRLKLSGRQPGRRADVGLALSRRGLIITAIHPGSP
jgi:hypothetical protein